jgi:membrane protease YdiL (CAAX protease family)
MDERSPCTWCGAYNKSDAAYCGQCFKDPRTAPQPVAVGSAGLATVEATAAPMAPPPSSPVAPAVPSVSPRPLQFESPENAEKEVRWRLRDLSMVYAAAWGLPRVLELLVNADQQKVGILGLSLIFQIVGYVAAALVVALVIKLRHRGDWSSIGISWHDRKLDEVGRGALFGLLLIGIWLPVGLILRGGRFDFDRLMRLLVGETTTAGLLLAGVVLVVGAPLIEEIYYRGLMFAWLRRWGTASAVVASSLLFVNAHGALLIPPLLLLGFGLGIKRQTKSLWYTMGAHAAWNFVVLIVAAQVLLGGGLRTFSSDVGGYSFKHRPAWERVSDLETTNEGATVDFASESPMGSLIMVGRITMPPLPPDQALPLLLDEFQESITLDNPGPPGTPQLMTRSFDGFPVAYEVKGSGSDDGTEIRTHLIALMKPTGDTSLVLSLVCPEIDCEKSQKDFARVLETLRLE